MDPWGAPTMGTAVGGAWHGLPTLADGEIGRVLLPSAAGTMGRPRHRPDALLADGGSDHDKYRRLLSQRGIHPVIAARGQPTAAARASSGTSSRERSPGCTAPAACVSAGSDATTSTRRSSASSPASAPPTRPTPRLCGTHRQSGPRPTGAGGSRRASLPSVPCATPTPASSSKPRVDRLSRPLARARRPWLYSAYIHALHARRGQARSRRHGCLVQRGGELPGNP